MAMLAQALGVLALLASCDARRTSWIPPEDGVFTPVADGEGITYGARWGRYQRVGRWVHVHLDVELRNLDPRRAGSALEIVPPLDPDHDTRVWTGRLSAVYSDLGAASAPTGPAAELALAATPGASICVMVPGRGALDLGLGETRRVVGEIRYRTDGYPRYPPEE
jgi:hypothetical protein